MRSASVNQREKEKEKEREGEGESVSEWERQGGRAHRLIAVLPCEACDTVELPTPPVAPFQSPNQCDDGRLFAQAAAGHILSFFVADLTAY